MENYEINRNTVVKKLAHFLYDPLFLYFWTNMFTRNNNSTITTSKKCLREAWHEINGFDQSPKQSEGCQMYSRSENFWQAASFQLSRMMMCYFTISKPKLQVVIVGALFHFPVDIVCWIDLTWGILSAQLHMSMTL